MNNNVFLNPAFWAAFFGVLIAQILKPIIYACSGSGWNFRLIFANGGMPSSHTSGVVALTTAIGIQEGFGSTIFILSLVFSLVIMNDAFNVRLETGKQSELLNEWLDFFKDVFKTNNAFSKTHFKTMVGHTVVQVFWGFIIGVAVGILTIIAFRYV